jgi:iron complex outermembrane receptor protein
MQLKQLIKAGVAGFSLASCSGILWAADDTNSLAVLKSMSLEDLGNVQVHTVVAASKYEQKTTEAPASVSIITQDEIKRYGYRTLAEILGSVQGFYVSNDRNYSYVGVRGMSLGDVNSRVLLLIDGHRMNDNLTDSAMIGTEFMLDVDLIDRVEIIRGPGAALYGNNAFFAVINVITRKAGQVNGIEASGEYGNYDTYKVRFTAGKSFTNGVACLLSGTYYNSAGEDQLFFPKYNTPAQNNGVARNMDGDWYGSLFGSLSYWDLILEGGWIRREKVNPTAPDFTTFNDPRMRTVDDDSYVDLKYAHDFSGVADVTARLYCDRHTETIGYPYSTSPGGEPYFVEYLTGTSWGAELQLNKKLWDKDMISVGAEYRDDFSLNDRLVDPSGTYTGLQDLHSRRQNDGVFAQGDFALLDELHLNSGVRYDQYGDFAPFFSPRLALIYNPLEQSTFKAIYGTAFRAPSFEEQTALANQINHNIQPEKIETYELDYEQGIGQYLRSSLAGFYNQMDDLILYQNGAYGNVNADSKGMELALEGNWTNGVRCRASYTLEKAENRTGGGGFPNSPEDLVKLNLSVPVIKEKLFASLQFQYVSSRHTIYTSPNGGATLPGVDTPGFPILNFTILSKQIVKNLDVSASVYNLLDQSYADPSTAGHLEDQIPQAGRTFLLKLTYRF